MKRTRFRNDVYVRAHPQSRLGDPNYAHMSGLRLVCFTPDGYPVYRLLGWLERLFSRPRDGRQEPGDIGWDLAWEKQNPDPGELERLRNEVVLLRTRVRELTRVPA